MIRLAPLLLLLAGCAPLQERTSYPLEFASRLPSGPNEKGWIVALHEAGVDVGPVRFFEGPVLVSRRFSPWDLLVRRAVAHPGHYVPGESMGEWLGTHKLDLLAAAPARVGTVDAVTGTVGSMQLTLAGPVRLRGTATRDAESIDFTIDFTHEAALEGVRAEGEITAAPVLARVTVDVASWLSRVDFGASADDDGLFTFDPDTQAFNALSRAVANTGAYAVAFVAPESKP